MCYGAEHIYETTNGYLTLNMSMTVAAVGLSYLSLPYTLASLTVPVSCRLRYLLDEDLRFTMRSAIKTGKHSHERVAEIHFKKAFM